MPGGTQVGWCTHGDAALGYPMEGTMLIGSLERFSTSALVQDVQSRTGALKVLLHPTCGSVLGMSGFSRV